MAGKKISQLTKLTELTGTEIIPVAKDGQNYGVETLALLGISVYDIPEPLDDNYIYTPEQLAEIKKSIEDGKIIRFGGWSMPTVYFLEDDGEMVFDIDNGDWDRVIFTIKANGEWEINPPVDFFNYVVEMPNIVEGEELTGTLPAETFGDLLERLKRSGNVMFRYPQAGSSNPVNQYDIGISFRYYRTNITIIHAGGTREFSIIPSGNYTDRPVVSKQYQSGLLSRVNDYMYDMSGLLGKLAVRDGAGTDLKNLQQGHVFNINGELVGNQGFYQYINIEDTKIYYLKLLDSDLANYELCLFDHNDKLIKSIGDPTNGYFIFVGVAKIGVCSGIESLANAMIIKSFDIQDLTTVLNTQQGNRALYEAAGATYNEETGFYELNGLNDITEEQMKTIYVQTNHMDYIENMSDVFSGCSFRTNLGFKRLRTTNNRKFNLRNAFRENKQLEVMRLGPDNDVWPMIITENGSFNNSFVGCSSLKSILGYLKFTSLERIIISSVPLLQDIRIKNLIYNLSIPDSPLLSLESMQYLINNAINTLAITVTVHADVYAKIQDTTNTDWHALIASAQEKNITFATA